MPNNYVLLETIELTQSAASVTFDNIPQSGYTDLKIVASMRVTDGGEGANPPISRCEMTFNGNGTNYSVKMLYGLPNQSPSAESASGDNATRNFYSGAATSSNATANTFSSAEYYIPNFTSSNFKSFSIDNVIENNATASELDLTAGIWNNTAAITSVKLNPRNDGSFAANSTFSLYGVAAFGTTPLVAPKANGGNIVANDGTYWYHAFLSSGNFTPQVALTCDYLVVAGGGAGASVGGSAETGGGGGAGGYRTFTSQALTTTSYAVTIGAGGSSGSAGSVSSFNSSVAAGGGGGGGNTGGSGGGGLSANNSQRLGGAGNTPSTSPSQGNNGGDGNSSSNSFAGGGGGAGAVGGNGSSGQSGSGGIGSFTAISGGSATGLGILSGGNYYFSGGGGGGSASGVSVGSGGIGGGGSGNNAGLVNTGGGGGGGSVGDGSSRSGGSGIVIIRYAMV
jgi:hypothetical protein